MRDLEGPEMARVPQGGGGGAQLRVTALNSSLQSVFDRTASSIRDTTRRCRNAFPVRRQGYRPDGHQTTMNCRPFVAAAKPRES